MTTSGTKLKYVLVPDDFIVLGDGRSLFRIRSLSTGEAGGYIESEENLSHDGRCWVGGEARVYEGAQIRDALAETAKIPGGALGRPVPRQIRHRHADAPLGQLTRHGIVPSAVLAEAVDDREHRAHRRRPPQTIVQPARARARRPGSLLGDRPAHAGGGVS